MFTLIIGGAASGKSEYAEALTLALGTQRVYIATMQPFDAECRARIARHRQMRQHKGFETLECYTHLNSADALTGANVLLECLSNLVANERYSPLGAGAQHAGQAVLSGIHGLLGHCAHLTVVTNEVFSGGSLYEGDTMGYMKQLAQVNRTLAVQAEAVVEMVAGCPNVLKGKELLPCCFWKR